MSNIIYIAQIVLEATSPLVIGAGTSDLDNDAVVAKDFNSLPYIPGEGMTGIISELFEKKWDKEITIDIFGGEDEVFKMKEKETMLGSSFEISDAYLVDSDGKVKQQAIQKSELSDFHKIFLNLPKREHVCIEHTGTAKKGGKFDNEFVYKGSRFKFEIELNKRDYEKTEDYWESILEIINSTGFALGSGTTNGYGQVKIVSLKSRTYDLSNIKDFEAYLNHTVDLNASLKDAEDWSKSKKEAVNQISWQLHKSLSVTTNCIHIGAGYGDMDVDDTNYKEQVLTWNEKNEPAWKTYFVIPGTSIKGTVAHRVAYRSNKNNNCFIENIIAGIVSKKIEVEKININEDFIKYRNEVENIAGGIEELEAKKIKLLELGKTILAYEHKIEDFAEKMLVDYVGENNQSVKQLFGNASKSEELAGSIGNVIVDDVYIEHDKDTETIFEHNAIDRYTGGTIDTALYAEKVFTPGEPFELNFKIAQDTEFETKVLDLALEDLMNGNLPLGGKTNKGYGFLKTK